MTNLLDCLTAEQREEAKNYFAVCRNEMFTIFKDYELNAESFVVFLITVDGETKVATIKDFALDNDDDFTIGEDGYVVLRENVPNDVKDFLDKEIRKRICKDRGESNEE